MNIRKDHKSNFNFNDVPTHLNPSLTQILADSQSSVNRTLDVSLQASTKVSEHCRSTAQHDVIVQRPSDVDRAVLDHVVHDLGDWCCEVRIGELGMEENLRSQEPFITDVNVERLSRDAVGALIRADPL